MKLQKTTLGLLIVAILLGGGVYLYELVGKPHQQEAQSSKQKIFNFKEQDIKTLTIKKNNQVLTFEQTNNPTQAWRMKQPEDAATNDAVISFLVNLLVGGESDRNFTIPSDQKKDYGLDSPLATINIQLKNNQNHQLILGKTDFQDQYLYAQVDPPSQTQKDITINLVPKDFQYAVERNPAEWKQIENKPDKTNSQQKSSPTPQKS